MEQTKQEIESIINEIQKNAFQYEMLITNLIEYKTKIAQDLKNLDKQIADLQDAQDNILAELQTMDMVKHHLKHRGLTVKEVLQK